MQIFLTRALVVVLLSVAGGFGPAARVQASSAGDSLRAADAGLNTAYQQALAAMPGAESKSKLRESQRAWVAFRDAEIAVKISLPGTSGNGLKILQLELTEIRAKQLQELAGGIRSGGGGG